jgi:hypothetical protein
MCFDLCDGWRACVAAQVTRLYRDALRLLNSWCIDREIFNREAEKIRAEFDANKHHPKDSA